MSCGVGAGTSPSTVRLTNHAHPDAQPPHRSAPRKAGRGSPSLPGEKEAGGEKEKGEDSREPVKPALAVFCLALLCGCASLPREPKPPAATIAAGGSSVTQTGTADVPARAEVMEESRSVPLPSGSELLIDERAGTVSVRLSSATTLTSATRTERAEAPRAYQPRAPPTPSDLADGRATLLYRVGLAVGLALGVFGLVRGWDLVMYGGGAIAAACAAGLFVARHPTLFAVIGLGAALAVVGPIIWHAKLKRLPTPAPA